MRNRWQAALQDAQRDEQQEDDPHSQHACASQQQQATGRSGMRLPVQVGPFGYRALRHVVLIRDE